MSSPFRRLLAALTHSGPAWQPPCRPQRGDAVEAWLKAQRDRWDRHGDSSEFWHEFDGLLDEYRLHADTGTPLDQHAYENGTVDDCLGCYQAANSCQHAFPAFNLPGQPPRGGGQCVKCGAPYDSEMMK